VVERLAALNEWAFDRADEDEISILVAGVWAQYEVAFTWLPDMESAARQLFVRFEKFRRASAPRSAH